jgi:acyl-CoA ligase (AMP-forming) (exosortase A-associated)
MLLQDLILDRARTHGSNRALICGDEVLDYTALAEKLHSAARGLIGLGFRPGERVGIYLNKRFEGVITFFAANLAGGVFVPINPVLKAAQVQHILNDCNVAALVTSAAQVPALQDILGECPALRHVITVEGPADDAQLPTHVEQITWADLGKLRKADGRFGRRIDNDIASILYTSGSTGKPKGVVLSHRNMVTGAISVASYIGNQPDDVILSALPLSFDAGFSQLTTGFSVGASIVLLDYLLPRDVVKTAARFNVTGLTGVPPLWNQLAKLDWPDDAVESMRYFANTGGAMPTATLIKLRAQMPNAKPFLMYGLTEAFRSTYLPPEQVDNRPTSIGKAIPNAEILVVREDGSICGPGEPGELVHRGALVAMGYWNDPERTKQRFRPVPGQPKELPIEELAVYSGDTVVKDEDGFIYFVGRKDDMIKSSGYRISPTELEEVIYGTGFVIECAALGVPHSELGQAVVIAAYSQTPGDDTRDAIILECKRSLPNFMVPAMIVWQDSLPRNPNGKIDRKRLASELQDLFQDNAE